MGYYNPLALASRGRWVQVLNDDVVFRTPAWDIVGKKALEAGHALYPDGIFYGRTFDDLNTGYSCFPILTRQAVEALGWFFHPEFTSWGADIHLKNLFDIVGRVVDVPYHFDHLREHDHINQRCGWISVQNMGSAPGEAWRLKNIIEAKKAVGLSV